MIQYIQHYIYIDMISTLKTAVMFFLVLFVYLHVHYHLKTCNDMHVYMVDDALGYDLNELDKLRQPILFSNNCVQNHRLLTHTSTMDELITNCAYVNAHDMVDSFSSNMSCKIVPISDIVYGGGSSNQKLESDAPEKSTNDKKVHVFSSGNSQIMSRIIAHYSKYDSHFCPMYSIRNHDVWIGAHANTDMQYMLHFRTFFIPVDNEIHVKLTSPVNSRFLHPHLDYDDLCFKSNVDVWATEQDAVFECVDVTVLPGQYLYIPPYWWFSFRFEKITPVICLKYDSVMSMLSTIHHRIASVCNRKLYANAAARLK